MMLPSLRVGEWEVQVGKHCCVMVTRGKASSHVINGFIKNHAFSVRSLTYDTKYEK